MDNIRLNEINKEIDTKIDLQLDSSRRIVGLTHLYQRKTKMIDLLTPHLTR